MTTYRIGDIQPNPFRDIENYPFREKTIETLRASFRNTSVWPTIVARLRDGGTPEIAFGHHRVEAARREYGEDGAIPLNVEDLNDAAMLRMMANENMEEYASAASVAQETVRQVVLAYAAGRIELGAPSAAARDFQNRYAPSFQPGVVGGGAPYTAVTIADFLGWNETKVKEALGALEETERGTFTPADFHGLTQKQARAAVTSVRFADRVARHRGMDPTPVREAAARAAITSVKSGAGHERVRSEAERAIDRAAPPKTRDAVPRDVAETVERMVAGFFTQACQVGDRKMPLSDLIEVIGENRDSISLQGSLGPMADTIARCLRRMFVEANRLANALAPRDFVQIAEGITA